METKYNKNWNLMKTFYIWSFITDNIIFYIYVLQGSVMLTQFIIKIAIRNILSSYRVKAKWKDITVNKNVILTKVCCKATL